MGWTGTDYIDQISTMGTLDTKLTRRCLNVDILVFQLLPYWEKWETKICELQKHSATLSQAAARSLLYGSKTKNFLKLTRIATDSIVPHRQVFLLEHFKLKSRE